MWSSVLEIQENVELRLLSETRKHTQDHAHKRPRLWHALRARGHCERRAEPRGPSSQAAATEAARAALWWRRLLCIAGSAAAPEPRTAR